MSNGDASGAQPETAAARNTRGGAGGFGRLRRAERMVVKKRGRTAGQGRFVGGRPKAAPNKAGAFDAKLPAIRCDAELKAYYEQQAKAAGLKLSDCLRQTLEANMKKVEQMDLAELKAEAQRLKDIVNDLNSRLADGRRYLMSVRQDEITVEDTLEAFGWTRSGF